MTMNPSRRRALWLGGGMAGAAMLAQWARPARGAAAVPDLDALVPRELDGWRTDEVMSAFVRPAGTGKVSGIYDGLLERTYVDAGGRRVMLSIAFGAEQSANLQLHRPEICYRAGGYQVGAVTPGVLQVAGRALPVHRLHAELPGRFEPITYWTLLGGEAMSDAASFRRRRVQAALDRQLLDGLLVRLSSIDADAPRAWQLHERFADRLVEAIAPPRRAELIGA